MRFEARLRDGQWEVWDTAAERQIGCSGRYDLVETEARILAQLLNEKWQSQLSS